MSNKTASHFKGRTAVITGAGSGIGRALAVQLARHGARLALSDVSEAGLAETLRQCEGGQARGYRVDVSRRDEVFRHADEVKRDFGGAHFVFNNAGVTLVSTIAHSTMEEIDWQLGVNLWGVIHGTKAFLPMMLAQRDGHVVNISSVFGMAGIYAQGPYNISKFGVRGLTECLWWELEGTGVKATTVHPGGIRTGIGHTARMGAHAGEDEQRLLPLMDKLLITPPEQCARAILDGVARGKRRIVTGHKARLIDVITRLLPTSYQALIRRDIEK